MTTIYWAHRILGYGSKALRFSGRDWCEVFCQETDGDDSTPECLHPIIVLSRVFRDLDDPCDRQNPAHAK